MPRKEKLFSVTKKDLVIQTFRAGGKGGQNQNKRETGVRIKHPDSGAVGEAREQRSQGQNKIEAFRRMVASKKFKLWIKMEASRVTGQLANIEKYVDEQMVKVKVESKNENGRWVDGLTEKENV